MYFVVANKVEAPKTDNLRDFVPNVEKYKVAEVLLCRKIEITTTTNSSIILIPSIENTMHSCAKILA